MHLSETEFETEGGGVEWYTTFWQVMNIFFQTAAGDLVSNVSHLDEF